ncbi:oxygen-independent coproporphyrinogen III oxidase [Piscinibacter sakaiensis]|uniref:oxygen-independent coproporphyrinogen III oxidase n=1 Tax=Piscinibacter sakaiensis TaxID=1547922 RepID=UPI003AB0F262
MPLPDPEVLRQMDRAGPRYTSYPTADRFVEAFTAVDYRRALWARAQGVFAGQGALPLSVYLHIPFCESVCYYCACNKIVTRHHDRAGPYLDALAKEVALHVEQLGHGQPVSQLHFGGGTPTFLSDDELARLLELLRASFKLLPNAEIAVEIDPRTVDPERLRRLAALGFNRISLGVQDVDPQVQRAVHRVQPEQTVRALLDEARSLGMVSTNVDLIYGLPLQSVASVQRTVASVSQMRPDRIALYGYAHLPQRFKPQRRIDDAQLPSGQTRLQMLATAIEGFTAAGYQYVGMDHFALPSDSLAVAKRQGLLHRNFQGYSTRPECDLIGLGVSAIGSVGASYSQNAKTLPEYYDALAQGQFPVGRGLILSRDDVLRRAVIMSLMCQGRIGFEEISQANLIDAQAYFASELKRLEPLQALGLVIVDDEAVEVTDIGWYLVRAIAMVFDRYAQADRLRAQFSRIV